MPSISPIDAAVSSTRMIGRYFSVVTMVPSVLLVLYVTLLIWAGAWSGPIDPGRIGSAFDESRLLDIGWFAVASLVVALIIHPLRFVTTQILEGYWGTNPVALRLTASAARRHHRKAVRLMTRGDSARAMWIVYGSARWRHEEPAPDPSSVRGADLENRQADALRILALPDGESVLTEYLAHQAYERARITYPEELRRIMPTELGNVLRRSEDKAGKQYGLDTMVIGPHLSLVAKPEHYAYVQDRQRAMDLAITMCLVSALATAASAVILADDGWWSLIAFVPFGFGYWSYMGAVAAAHSYNAAIETVSDLSRFALYDSLHVAQPKTGEEELQTAENLMKLLRGTPQPAMNFVHPELPPAGTTCLGAGPPSNSPSID